MPVTFELSTPSRYLWDLPFGLRQRLISGLGRDMVPVGKPNYHHLCIEVPTCLSQLVRAWVPDFDDAGPSTSLARCGHPLAHDLPKTLPSQQP